MKIYTISSFDGDGYQLVLASCNKELIDRKTPHEYDTDSLLIHTWDNDKVIHTEYRDLDAAEFE